MSFIESGMDFSPLFAHGESIYLEKSNFYKNTNKNGGIRTVEFISLRPQNRLCFIEAKDTVSDSGNIKDFSDNINKIADKFQHSLYLYVSRELGIRNDTYNEFPESFKSVIFPGWKIVFLLVINGHKREWLGDVSDALSEKLKALRKIMNVDVAVCNEEMALKWKMIKCM